MTNETDTRSEATRVLEEHTDGAIRMDAWVCSACGAALAMPTWTAMVEGTTGPLLRKAIAKHQTDLLAEGGLLREEPGSAEACGSEVWSMDYYRDGQVDPYWIRCNALGPHDEHEDANTGLTWPVEPDQAPIATQETAGQALADAKGGQG